MPSLLELQSRFAEALADPRADGNPRLAVYRNTISANYRNALSATYGVVKQLVGAAFFDAAVDEYVKAHPSTHGDLNEYGGCLADFLSSHGPAQPLGYLADVARLEWAIDEAQRAAKAARTPEDVIAALGAVPPEQVGSRGLALHPSCRLLASRFPVFRIWQVHQAGFEGERRVDFEGAADWMLVRRERYSAVVERLAQAEFEWLRSLRDGVDLESAVASAAQIDTGFDVGEALRRRITDGTLCGLKVIRAGAD